jgi:hypothetical protein
MTAQLRCYAPEPTDRPQDEVWSRLRHLSTPPDLTARGGNRGGFRRRHPPASRWRIFDPPYLFRGPRPVVTGAPRSVSRAQAFEVESPDAATIAAVVLARPSAVTHQTDTEQKILDLPFTRTGFFTFGTIATSGAVTDRFGVGNDVEALTFAAPDLGYGPNLFYFLRRDASGFSTFGTIATSGAVTDRFGVGNRFDALTFAPGNHGYGPNLFYYLRRDLTRLTVTAPGGSPPHSLA